MRDAPSLFEVVALNLPEHARNAIHTDEGARSAGFPAALVAGVTTYAYLTHVPLAAWGVDWLMSGGGELDLRSPVFAGDELRCQPMRGDDGRWVVEALVGDDATPRATFALRDAEAVPVVPLRDGEPLKPIRVQLENEWGADYAARAGDPFSLCHDEGLTHPAVWPALANHMVHRRVARGSWIHFRSRIRHHATAPVGAIADVYANVIERTVRRSGERATLDVAIEVDGRRVASIEHEAIVALPGAPEPARA